MLVLVHLEHLDISRNPLRVKDVDDLTCLPFEMRMLKNLKYLSLSECNLRCIPSIVWFFTTLEMLDLSRNKIMLLVPDVGNLQQLRYLNLSQCSLTMLPDEIGFCATLSELVLMANHMDSLPETLKECKQLQTLHISYRMCFTRVLDAYMEGLICKGQIKSEHMPAVVFELESLGSLDLSHTKINNFPDNTLSSIRTLRLNYNYIAKLHDGVFARSMANTLRELAISHNLLQTIPLEINSLVNLETLDLSYNAIAVLPHELRTLQLVEFNLENNKLTSNIKKHFDQ